MWLQQLLAVRGMLAQWEHCQTENPETLGSNYTNTNSTSKTWAISYTLILPVSFGRDTISQLVPSIWCLCQGSKISYTGGKYVTCHGITCHGTHSLKKDQLYKINQDTQFSIMKDCRIFREGKIKNNATYIRNM